MVVDLCINNGLHIHSAVGDGCICSAKFHIGDTVRDTAESERLSDICCYAAVAFHTSVDQGSETEVLQIIETKLRSYLSQTLNCDDVERLLDSIADRTYTFI